MLGLDVHKRTIAWCRLDRGGRIIGEGETLARRDAFDQLLDQQVGRRKTHVTLEARGSGCGGRARPRALRSRSSNFVFLGSEMEITQLLNRARDGDAEATERVIAILYDELRAIARAQMGGAAHTLQPTALVHEAYLRLVRREDSWENRRHFLGFAARAMRSVLVDHARARRRDKRGGGLEREPLHAAVAWFEENRIDLLDLEAALQRLEREGARQHRIVELRFFAGLGNAEVAETLSISLATVEREWAVARAWLYRYMADG